MTRVWYLVRDFDRGRAFYTHVLGFEETFVDWDDRWSKLERGQMRIALAEGEPLDGPDDGHDEALRGRGGDADVHARETK